MSKKITMETLAGQLQRSTGMSAVETEGFIKDFQELVKQALMTEGQLQIKGLGNLKILSVADRASVDVNTKQRIIIPGYKKVRFDPEEKTVEAINSDETTLTAILSVTTEVAETTPQKADESQPSETATVVPVEKTTRESRKPTEKKENPQPETTEIQALEDSNDEELLPEVPKAPVSEQSEPAPASKVEQPVVEVSTPVVEPSTDQDAKNKWWHWILAAALLVVVVVGSIIAFTNKGEEPAPMPDVNPSLQQKQAVEDSPQEQTERQPKVHVLQKGETLTTISVQYYNTPDSMGAIWRLNKFADPNNIPLGTAIKLP